jgi:hypothetical protein
MNREILFRGKPDRYWDGISMGEDYVKLCAGEAYKDGWVYGQLARDAYGMAWIIGHIVEWDEDYIYPRCWIPVDPKTVGQYTGMTDESKSKIFEGDLYRSNRGYIFEVVYLESEACFVGVPVKEPESWVFLEDMLDMKKVGNKWDNGDLLSGGDTHDW